jgi:hypothetical protein
MPKSNTSLNKFNVDTPESIARKQAMELVSNEFNDARKQVISREFNQVGLYNETFDRSRKLPDITVEFGFNNLLQKYIASIQQVSDQLKSGERTTSDNIIGAYGALISALKSYIDAKKKENPFGVINTKPWYDNVMESVSSLNNVLNEALKANKVDSNIITDKSIINLYMLIQQIQSGYNIQQADASFKGYDSLSQTQKTKYDIILNGLKSVGINYIRKKLLPLPIIDDIQKPVKQSQLDSLIENIQEQRKEAIERFVKQNITEEGDYRPYERSELAEINKKYDKLIDDLIAEFKNRPPPSLSLPSSNIEALPPPRRRERKPKGEFLPKPSVELPVNERNKLLQAYKGLEADMEATTDPETKKIAKSELTKIAKALAGDDYLYFMMNPDDYFNKAVGKGYARGGQAGFSLDKTRRIAEQWPNFPYYVPPNQPVVHMVNPRGRVHIPTEGSGRRRGNTIFKMIARSMGKKVDDNEGGFLPMLAARVVGKKLLKNVGKKVAKKAVENVVENEGGFLPMLAARVVGKKLLQKVGKKVAKNAVENAVLGEGNARGKSLSNLQALDHNRKERAKQAAFNSIPTVASVGTAVGIHHGKKALKNKINELTGEGKKKAKKAGKPKYDVI